MTDFTAVSYGCKLFITLSTVDTLMCLNLCRLDLTATKLPGIMSICCIRMKSKSKISTEAKQVSNIKFPARAVVIVEEKYWNPFISSFSFSKEGESSKKTLWDFLILCQNHPLKIILQQFSFFKVCQIELELLHRMKFAFIQSNMV